MEGTLYHDPTREAGRFVREGQNVSADGTQGSREGVKMLNRYEDDRSGVGRRILRDDGQPVEFDRPLFVIE